LLLLSFEYVGYFLLQSANRRMGPADMATLLPYMTGRDANVSAGPTAYTWYDELIVSSQAITAPNN